MVSASPIQSSPLPRPLFSSKLSARPMVAPKPVHFGQGQGQGQNQAHPDILYASDIDNTFLPWKEGKYHLEIEQSRFEELKQTVLKYQDRFLMSFVSGRGLSAIKMLADYFKEIPIRFLALDNGKQLFENHLKLPADQWLRQLSATDKDQGWENELKTQALWDSKQVTQATLDTLQKQGFREAPDSERPAIALENEKVFWAEVSPYPNPLLRTLHTLSSGLRDLLCLRAPVAKTVPLEVIVNPDETVLYLMSGDPSEAKTYERWGAHLSKALVKTLQKRGHPIQAQMSRHPEYLYYFFEPTAKAVNKASVIDFILSSKCPEALAKGIQGVFTFGDSQNDVVMLQRRHFTGPGGREIPAYPTLSGTDLVGQESLQNHPRLQVAPQQGALSESIRTNLAKVLPSTPVS